MAVATNERITDTQGVFGDILKSETTKSSLESRISEKLCFLLDNGVSKVVYEPKPSRVIWDVEKLPPEHLQAHYDVVESASQKIACERKEEFEVVNVNGYRIFPRPNYAFEAFGIPPALADELSESRLSISQKSPTEVELEGSNGKVMVAIKVFNKTHGVFGNIVKSTRDRKKWAESLKTVVGGWVAENFEVPRKIVVISPDAGRKDWNAPFVRAMVDGIRRSSERAPTEEELRFYEQAARLALNDFEVEAYGRDGMIYPEAPSAPGEKQIGSYSQKARPVIPLEPQKYSPREPAVVVKPEPSVGHISFSEPDDSVEAEVESSEGIRELFERKELPGLPAPAQEAEVLGRPRFVLSADYSDFDSRDRQALLDQKKLQARWDEVFNEMDFFQREEVAYYVSAKNQAIGVTKGVLEVINDAKQVMKDNGLAEIGFLVTTRPTKEDGVRVTGRVIAKAFAATESNIYFTPVDLSSYDWEEGEEITMDVHTHPPKMGKQDWAVLSTQDIRGVGQGTDVLAGPGEKIRIDGSGKAVSINGVSVVDNCRIVAVQPVDQPRLACYWRDRKRFSELMRMKKYNVNSAGIVQVEPLRNKKMIQGRFADLRLDTSVKKPMVISISPTEKTVIPEEKKKTRPVEKKAPGVLKVGAVKKSPKQSYNETKARAMQLVSEWEDTEFQFPQKRIMVEINKLKNQENYRLRNERLSKLVGEFENALGDNAAYGHWVMEHVNHSKRESFDEVAHKLDAEITHDAKKLGVLEVLPPYMQQKA